MTKDYYYFSVKSRRFPDMKEQIFYIQEKSAVSPQEEAVLIAKYLFYERKFKKADVYVSSCITVEDEMSEMKRRSTNISLHRCMDMMLANEFKKERRQNLKQFFTKLLSKVYRIKEVCS